MASDKELLLTVGPARGVSDVRSLAAQDAQRFAHLQNMYAPQAVVGGDLISRPGITRIPLVSTITGTASKAGTTITGVGTAFLTEIAVGDIIEMSSTKMLVTVVTDNTTATASISGTVASSAITRYAGGIVTGPILGVYRYANTDGTIKRFVIARTLSNLASQDAASRYVFDDSDATSTALTGTIAFAGATANVVGTGTLFTTELEVGQTVTFGNFGAGEIDGGWRTGSTFRVASISNNTSMNVHTNNTGTGDAGGGTVTKQSGGIRFLEYDPAATPTIKDRTSATMNRVALDTSARIYGTTFANYFIISDETNRPRKITSAFVLSNMTDANYAFKGRLVQYYGKLFGIDASDAITLRWSDENNADTGFGTGTSDNSWALRQTSADQLTALAATNDALYCFRQNSVAIITGAANSDFRSSGSVDAIQNIGCLSPDAVCVINGSVVFLDQYARPGRIAPGYGYLPLWKRIQETIRGAALTTAQLRAATCVYDPTTNLVKFSYRTATGSTTNDQLIVFEPDEWECLGVHIWYASGSTALDHAYATVWEDQNNKPRHVIASGTTADLAFSIQKTEDDQAASATDTLAAGAQTVAVIVEPPKVGGDVLLDKIFTRMAVGTRNVGGTTAGVTLWKSQYKGPNVTAYTSAEAMYYGGSTTIPSGMTLDGAALKAEQQGLDLRGRWMQARFTNDITGNPLTRATFDTLTVIATPGTSDYSVR